MTDSSPKTRFAHQLLRQESVIQTPRYEAHRMELELQLKRAERNERSVYWIVVCALIVGVAAGILLASHAVGSPDPGDMDATLLSVTLGVTYWIAAIVFFVGLASYYSRFQVATKGLKERLIFESIREIRQEVFELRKLIEDPKDRQVR